MSETLIVAIVTGIVTFLAASVPKWLEQRSVARKQQSEEQAALRDDLRKMIAERDALIERKDGEIERGRERYYSLRERHLALQTRYGAMVIILRANSLDHLVANIEAHGLDEDEDEEPAEKAKETSK